MSVTEKKWTRAQGRGGSFSRVAPKGLNVTKPGAHTVELSGRWTPGDPVHPSILWGYRPAAHLRAWTIRKAKKAGEWALEAGIDRTEPFMLRQQPLFFAAPRQKGGFWMWPVIGNVESTGPNSLRATLGQPDQ